MPPSLGPFVADPVDGQHVDAVGDGMGALHGLPGVGLGLAELGLLGRVPADGGGIEEDLGPLKRRQAGGLGIPLVPADERAERGGLGGERLEAEVAGGEVELLVVERIVGDVHLAVEAEDRPVGVEDDRRVVVDPRRPPLEDRADDRPSSSRGRPPPGPRSSGRGSARRGRRTCGPRPGRNTASGTTRAGKRPSPLGRRPRGGTRRRAAGCQPGRSSSASGSGR